MYELFIVSVAYLWLMLAKQGNRFYHPVIMLFDIHNQ